MAGNVAVLSSHMETSDKLEVQRSMTIKEKNASEAASKRATELSEQKMGIESSLKEERTKAENLDKENQSLKVSLQAKREAQEKAKQVPVQQATLVAHQPAPAVQVSGDKQSWLAASGIPQSDWGYVDSIVTRESGWNPNAVNPSSGACGLGQQLPCGKWSGAWNDPVAALVAQHGYVKERYGSYAGAVAFWNSNHWY